MSKNNKDVDTRIRRMCLLAMTSEDEMSKLGAALLETFQDVCRYNIEAAIDTVSDLCSYNGDWCIEAESEAQRMSEALIRLEFFAAEESRHRFEDNIDEMLHTG